MFMLSAPSQGRIRDTFRRGSCTPAHDPCSGRRHPGAMDEIPSLRDDPDCLGQGCPGRPGPVGHLLLFRCAVSRSTETTARARAGAAHRPPAVRCHQQPGAGPWKIRFPMIEFWRRRWDSNPRWSCLHAGFQDRYIRPLCHPSGTRTIYDDFLKT